MALARAVFEKERQPVLIGGRDAYGAQIAHEPVQCPVIGVAFHCAVKGTQGQGAGMLHAVAQRRRGRADVTAAHVRFQYPQQMQRAAYLLNPGFRGLFTDSQQFGIAYAPVRCHEVGKFLEGDAGQRAESEKIHQQRLTRGVIAVAVFGIDILRGENADFIVISQCFYIYPGKGGQISNAEQKR